MARSKQPRLLEAHLNEIDSVEVVHAPEQWVVTYQNQLISICRQRWTRQPKYLRTLFPTAAPAENLAAKLNNLFETKDFDIRKIQ